MVAHMWKPGQSGNPRGLPAEHFEVVRLARTSGTSAVIRLSELMYSEDDRVAVVACQAILDRAYGRVKAAEDPPSEEQQIEAMTPEQRRAEIAELVAKARGVLAERGPVIGGEADDDEREADTADC